MADPATITTVGSTYENRSNLAASFFTSIIKKYEGTRLGRQELEAELLDDVPGSLWTRTDIDRYRVETEVLPDMQRTIVAIDPAAGGDSEQTAETGIVCGGIGVDGRGYVLEDGTIRGRPREWVRRALALVDIHAADAIVAEVNQGGDMVEQVIKSERPTMRVIKVRASRGKVTRAEPVAALYEQGRISHVGRFDRLEDQMVLFTPWGIEGGELADRVDALVWLWTELFLQVIRGDRRTQHVDPDQSWVV